jgi:maltose O-acetyltransferase
LYAKLQSGIHNPKKALIYLASVVKALYYRVKYQFILGKAAFGRGVRIEGQLRIKGPGKVIIGDYVICAGTVTPYTHGDRAIIVIGDNVFLNGTRFGAARRIAVGSNCILADCRIMDTDFHSLRKDRWSKEAPVGTSPVQIGNNVWIAAQAAVLKGVTIGENTVVGFGAVVTKDLAANVVAAGNPARVLGKVPG